MNLNTDKIYNLLIKVLILASKFLLMICLAKSLEAYELGIYGLIQSIVVYYMYFCGCDLYTYSTREYIRTENELIFIKHSKAIISISIAGILITLVALKGINTLFEYIHIIVLLCFLEHYNQEVGRMLIAKKYQLKAGIQLFIRSSSWCYIIAVVVALNITKIELIYVLGLWALCSFFSLLYGSYILFRATKVNINDIMQEKLTKNWLIKVFKTSSVFFIGTLAVRTIFVLDKSYFEYTDQLNDLGVYVFYSSFAGVLLSFCDSAIFQFSYPKLIQLYKDGKNQLMKNEMIKMLIQCLAILVVFSLGSYIFLGYLIEFIGKDEYVNNIEYFWWLLLINFILASSTIFHYVIYAFNYDKAIMMISILSLLSFIVVLVIGDFYSISAINTVVLAVLVSTLVTGIMKLLKVREGFKKEF